MKKINRLFIHSVCMAVMTVMTQVAFSQTGCPSYTGSSYQPLTYYTFDDSGNPLGDCLSSGTVATNGLATISNNTGGQVDNFCRTVPNNPNVTLSTILGTQFYTNVFNSTTYGSNPFEYTYEFAFRINSDFYEEIDFYVGGSALFRLGTNYIQWLTDYYSSSSSGLLSANLSKNLYGFGRFSPNYFLDHSWHHIALRFDGTTGSMSIWIDGQTSIQLTEAIPAGSMPYSPAGVAGFHPMNMEDNGSMDFDEVAFYDQALPDWFIVQHYNDITLGNHYSCPTSSVGITVVDPGQSFQGTNYNSTDFAPNYYFYGSGFPATLSDLGPTVPGVAEQLKDYPLPRRRKGHKLNPNVNWMNPSYLGRVGGVEDAANDVDIQGELCSHWNYMFNLSPGAAFASTPGYQSALNTFANSNPQIKCSVITNINHINQSPGWQMLYWPAEYINVTTPTNTCTSATNWLAPNYNTKDHFIATGQVCSEKIVSNVINDDNNGNAVPLTRSINYISENGIENPIFTLDPTGCPYDGVMSSQNLFGNIYSGEPDGGWIKHYGMCRKILETAYADAIVGSHSLIPSSCTFSRYNISGIPIAAQYFEWYYEMRRVNTPLITPCGNSCDHYPTPNFYITSPASWNVITSGANWTWNQFMPNEPTGAAINPNSRLAEIALGDSLFAPFVSAGWEQESINLRPGQWLGLLKGLGMLGADYYHTSYFNVTDVYGHFATGTTNPVDPRGWCYQAAMPSYAQGITSRFEKFLHAGPIAYHKTRNQTLSVIRSYSDKHLIYGTLQQCASLANNMPLSTTYHINDVNAGTTLNGLKYEIRRQGSTYFYDSQSGVFYQLDKWHQSEHPSFWSKDFEFEAELNDYTDINNSSGENHLIDNTMSLVTDNPSVDPKDFTNYTTYIEYAASGAPTTSYYYFEPRDAASNSVKTYYLWVRASRTNTSCCTYGKMDVNVTGPGSTTVTQLTIPCIKPGFVWYNYSVGQGLVGVPLQRTSFTVTANSEYEISFVGNQYVHFDKFILTEDSIIPLGVDSAGAAQELIGRCSLSNRPAGVDELSDASVKLSVRPNPNNGNFNVEFEADNNVSIKRIRMTNVQGQQIFMREYSGQKAVNMNTENLNNGIYFLEVFTGQSTIVRKIIISK